MGQRKAKEIISFYIGGMGEYYRELLVGFGYGAECARICELYSDKATRPQAADAVTDAMMEALTVTGDPKRCVEELERRRTLGVDLPILALPPEVPWPMMEAFIKGLAPTE